MNDQPKFKLNYKKAMFFVVIVSLIATAGFNPDLLNQLGYFPKIPLWGVERVEPCPLLEIVFC